MSEIQVNTQSPLFPITPDLYGLFFEDINRAGDSGLYPEMLRNRAFEDSILPAGCPPLNGTFAFETPTGWRDAFNNGEGLTRWMNGIAPTHIPAWYTNGAEITLNQSDTLNKNRLASLQVSFQKNGQLYNTGFHGISVEAKKSYDFYMFAKAPQDTLLQILLEDSQGNVLAHSDVFLKTSDSFGKYDISFLASGTDHNSRLVISSKESCAVQLGFTSLMPRDTYKAHGMRKDLMEMLSAMSPKFLRFPGGCIVEGFTKETIMRFKNTIGPVWERPSHMLMWHYRTTNGLGYHEYLQICEDLGANPLYVINCGITCQGRGPIYLEGNELEELLQDAIDAIDYAIAPADSNKWGALRAQNGHPEPFGMKYIEIGNENNGPEYLYRYKKFYSTLKERYPDIIFISNCHTENDGLPTEMVDEHYYRTPEYFQGHQDIFDSYDRNGPRIFVGEYAVTSGKHVGDLYSALGESMYLTGIEKNQDIVQLTSYAPLFQNVNYTAWYPDLISYNNHEVSALPLYYIIQMMASNRGTHVLDTSLKGNVKYTENIGIPGLITYKNGVRIKNIFYNGAPAVLTHQTVGSHVQNDNEFQLFVGPNPDIDIYAGADKSLKEICYVTFGEEPSCQITFETDIYLDSPDIPFAVTLWNEHYPMLFAPDETCERSPEWSPVFTEHFSWLVKNGCGTGCTVHWLVDQPVCDPVPLPIVSGEYMHIKLEADNTQILCYINDALVQTIQMKKYPCTGVCASSDDQEIQLKIVNMSDSADSMTIRLDCNVESSYEALVLTGDSAEARNTLDNPKNVAPVLYKKEGAGREFVFEATPLSFNVLKLKKV